MCRFFLIPFCLLFLVARHGRLATVPGRSGKPSIIVTKEMGIFIGNEVSDQLDLCGCELFGFNTGNYEVKAAENDRSHNLGIAWRLKGDTDLISENKSLMPACTFLQKCANARGLADISVPDHTISPMLHTPVFLALPCVLFTILFLRISSFKLTSSVFFSTCHFRIESISGRC